MIQWVKFWLLAVIWGSSFLLIKVAVDDLGVFPLVSVRLGLAAILFLAYLHFVKRRLPRDVETLGPLIFVGIFNTAMPFILISWGETKIDSGLATVLNATVPLFNLLIAHFALSDERLTQMRIIGLVVGFLGIVVLMSRSIGSNDDPLIGQLAVIGGAICYAISIVVIRLRLRHVDPMVTAGWSLAVGAFAVVITTTLLVRPLPEIGTLTWEPVVATVTLAIINTVIAYFLFYDLIDKWGVRASLVTYAMPPIGVSLGFIVLDEQVDWRLIVGGLMILAGIVVTKTNAQLNLTAVRLRLLAHLSRPG